jgi:HlyD family type I secretion membrane fusion protein
MTTPKTIKPVTGDYRKYAIAGYFIIVFGIGGLFTWASVAEIASAVIAPGTVSVESNRKTIQHYEGGIIKEILVEDAAKVKQGDVLMRLEPIRAQSEENTLNNQLVMSRALKARLEAEWKELEEIEFPKDLTEDESPNVIRALEDQIGIFNERKHSIENQISILNSRIEQSKDRINGLNTQVKSLRNQSYSLSGELDDLRMLAANGHYPRNGIKDKERQLYALSGDIGRADSEIAETKTLMGEAELQIGQIKQDFKEQVVNELGEVRVQVADLQERLNVAQDIFDRVSVRAPIDGIVQNLKHHTIGGVIRPGEDIIDIVPVQDNLIINAEVSPVDIDSVSQGQEAQVRFPSFEARLTPTILGTVQSVSADALIDERQGISYFMAKVHVQPDTVDPEIMERLQPGMPAEIVIATGNRTVLSYLVKPLSDAVTRTMREK